MNKPGKLGLCVALLFAPAVLFAQGENRAAKVDEIFAKWNTRDTPGCAVAVAESLGLGRVRDLRLERVGR